jgi:hypothetical protein
MERTVALEQVEQLVVTAAAPLNGAYGVRFYDKAKQLSGRQEQFRPEHEGRSFSWTMPDITRRGGRIQRSYAVEQTGVAALRHSAPTAVRSAALNRYGERLWAGEELTG